MKRLALIFIALLLVSAACSSGAATFDLTLASTPLSDLPVSHVGDAPELRVVTPVPLEVVDAADAEYLLLANLYERATLSVVNIEAEIEAADGTYTDVSRGSGFVYDNEGHIITNAHVVRNSTEIRVTFNNGYIIDAEVVGADSYSDLAVIRVETEASRLQPLSLADSDRVRVGQRAIAIGNPFGLNSSMSAGIVSGLGRTLDSAALIDTNAVAYFNNPSIIQTDTPINPGNSGGPLLNSQGEVIGVTTAIRSDNGVFQGVGFAVPANTLRRVVPELIDHGSVDYAWLGINVAPESEGLGVAAIAQPLDLPVEEGVLVQAVTENSPAAKAGLRGGTRTVNVRDKELCAGGDIIVAIDDMYVGDMDALLSYMVVNTAPGDVVTLRVIRDGQTFDVPVTLEGRPESATVPQCG
ncbi:trypsin-like peptidase domain-containing protein [Phototrophicus methaneseepsis]|uniref:Trypsin-like peptidase domain-containing protein n=1 Tax=Phototrophicus methaneseepsis TaxID=2710758 RepID=A0A7S8E8R7_9CHLR|nr:trypsin-like peptidase domain-containing protein [Phototrophicus methaneseepsis]QPC82445.1 trypsin-like peptidase domain-containing protein [Phototrophicus methaneseepsis]